MHALVMLLSPKISLKFTFKAWIQEVLGFYLSLSSAERQELKKDLGA